MRLWSGSPPNHARCEFCEVNVSKELTDSRINDWFRWKNGTPLSEAKQESVNRNFLLRRGELIGLEDRSAEILLSKFSEGGAIWRIFWLHCWQPTRFPIYDQHVHRAMRFIQTGEPEEIPSGDNRKIRAYLEEYLPFHASFAGLPQRAVDKALWAFGMFINENNFPHRS